MYVYVCMYMYTCNCILYRCLYPFLQTRNVWYLLTAFEEFFSRMLAVAHSAPPCGCASLCQGVAIGFLVEAYILNNQSDKAGQGYTTVWAHLVFNPGTTCMRVFIGLTVQEVL